MKLDRQNAPILVTVVLGALILLPLKGCGGGGGGTPVVPVVPPVANAGHDTNALLNALVVLDGSTSTSTPGSSLTYTWAILSRPASSAAILSNVSSISPTFTTDIAGTYTISLVVNDGISASAADTVTITALSSVSNIRDTGQDTCYNNLLRIACPNSGEPFFGQDAVYSTNPLRLVDNGLTVTDGITGLTWQKTDDGATHNWYEATGIFHATFNPFTTNVCGSLSLGGFSDWRLPSRRELVRIINYMSGTDGAAATAYFQSSGSDYWTSTTVVGSDVAWGVTGGAVTNGVGNKGTSAFVRCVRGTSWGQNSFVDNGNGSVTDSMSGLIWQKNDDGTAKTWGAALAYCENLTLAGSSDWRLPDIKELESLANISSSNETPSSPAADIAFFPTTQNAKYWSSTTAASTTAAAWEVDFGTGSVDQTHSDKGATLFARCVR